MPVLVGAVIVLWLTGIGFVIGGSTQLATPMGNDGVENIAIGIVLVAVAFIATAALGWANRQR